MLVSRWVSWVWAILKVDLMSVGITVGLTGVGIKVGLTGVCIHRDRGGVQDAGITAGNEQQLYPDPH